MNNLYSLESLIEIFTEHAKQAEENQKKNISAFKENSPNDPLPDYMKDDFNLPLAFAIICQEILEIKKKLKDDRYV